MVNFPLCCLGDESNEFRFVNSLAEAITTTLSMTQPKYFVNVGLNSLGGFGILIYGNAQVGIYVRHEEGLLPAR